MSLMTKRATCKSCCPDAPVPFEADYGDPDACQCFKCHRYDDVEPAQHIPVWKCSNCGHTLKRGPRRTAKRGGKSQLRAIERLIRDAKCGALDGYTVTHETEDNDYGASINLTINVNRPDGSRSRLIGYSVGPRGGATKYYDSFDEKWRA